MGQRISTMPSILGMRTRPNSLFWTVRGAQSGQGVPGRLDRLKLEWPSSTEDQIWTGGAGGGVAELAARFPWTGRHLCAGLLVALAVAQIARLSLLASG